MNPDLMTNEEPGETPAMEQSEETAEPTSGAAASEQCVPVDALAMPDDSEQLAAPEVGDVVDYHVQGKVTKVENGMAYVTPSSINGKPVAGSDDEDAEDGGADEAQEGDDAGYSQLEDQARGMGSMQG